MKYAPIIGFACFCGSLIAEERSQPEKVKVPCSSCDKGTSRLAMMQGGPASPENSARLHSLGETLTLSLPSLGDQKSMAKIAVTINNIDGAMIEESCLNSHCSVIKYDPEKVTKAEIINQLTKIGVVVAGEKLSYHVAGMTCTGCSGKLTNVLSNTPGVINVETVSHETKSATLVIDPKKTDSDKIIKAINQTGYKVIAE